MAKKIIKNGIAAFLLLLTLNSMAQSEDILKNLIDKKWQSKWKFDPSKDILTLYSDSSKETSEMKIYNLTETEFVFQTTNSEGMTMTIHMINSIEK